MNHLYKKFGHHWYKTEIDITRRQIVCREHLKAKTYLCVCSNQDNKYLSLLLLDCSNLLPKDRRSFGSIPGGFNVGTVSPTRASSCAFLEKETLVGSESGGDRQLLSTAFTLCFGDSSTSTPESPLSSVNFGISSVNFGISSLNSGNSSSTFERLFDSFFCKKDIASN